MTDTLTQVHRAHEAAKAAVDALFQQLKTTYPKGSRWKVYLRDCQTRPTVATVLYWHWGLDPVVVFSIPTRKEIMRRRVPVSKILGPA